MRGVGYLTTPQETRKNVALQSHFYASSEKAPRTSTVSIETQPNQPLPDKGSVKNYTRTHTYQAAHVADESNGTRWMAADTDSSPFITADLKEVRKVSECHFFFTRPTEGHTWKLEKSVEPALHILPMVSVKPVISVCTFAGGTQACGNGRFMNN